MGGRIPYGFTKTDTVIDGIKASMYVPVPEEAEQMSLMEYINNRVEALDTERKRLQEEILSLTCQLDSDSLNVITNHVKQWEETAFCQELLRL